MAHPEKASIETESKLLSDHLGLCKGAGFDCALMSGVFCELWKWSQTRF